MLGKMQERRAKMANFKTNAMRLIERAKLPYEVLQYPHHGTAVDAVTVASFIGRPTNMVFKTIVTTSGKEFFVFVLPATTELDLKKAAKAVGAKAVELIKPADINKVTGYIRGGCSPIGMKKQYRTTFAQQITGLPQVIVSAGKIGWQVALAPGDLIALTGGQVADITA